MRKSFLCAIILLLIPPIAYATPVTFDLTSGVAISFQDSDYPEGEPETLTADQTNLLKYLDASWAPEPTGTVVEDYYATGTSELFFDAISLTFDLASVGYENIESATLRFFTQKGDYAHALGYPYSPGRNEWQHYEVLPGAFNPLDQDVAPGGATGPIVDFGYSSILDPNITIGWLEASINPLWITDDTFEVTLRLWNARIDKVELAANVIPEPATMLLLGSGLIGLAGFRRKNNK